MQNNQYQALPYLNPYGPNDPTQQGIVRPNIGSKQINGIALAHQAARGIPRFLADSAKKKGIIDVLFYANGLAGNESETIVLNYATVPLSMVWLLGVTDKNGSVTSAGGGLVPGSIFGSGTVLEGMEIFSGAKANYSCNKDDLIVKVTSTNVGWPDFLVASFYYMVFYDDAGVGPRGL